MVWVTPPVVYKRVNVPPRGMPGLIVSVWIAAELGVPTVVVATVEGLMTGLGVTMALLRVSVEL